MSENQQPATSKAKPAAVFRAGALSVSVWRRDHNGEVFYNATPQRSYTKDDGKSWNYTDSFSRDDLPIVSRLLDQSFAWIVNQQSKA